jgi:hypothetical protein
MNTADINPLANLAAYLLNQAARERQEQEQQKEPPPLVLAAAKAEVRG